MPWSISVMPDMYASCREVLLESGPMHSTCHTHVTPMSLGMWPPLPPWIPWPLWQWSHSIAASFPHISSGTSPYAWVHSDTWKVYNRKLEKVFSVCLVRSSLLCALLLHGLLLCTWTQSVTRSHSECAAFCHTPSPNEGVCKGLITVPVTDPGD